MHRPGVDIQNRQLQDAASLCKCLCLRRHHSLSRVQPTALGARGFPDAHYHGAGTGRGGLPVGDAGRDPNPDTAGTGPPADLQVPHRDDPHGAPSRLPTLHAVTVADTRTVVWR